MIKDFFNDFKVRWWQWVSVNRKKWQTPVNHMVSCSDVSLPCGTWPQLETHHTATTQTLDVGKVYIWISLTTAADFSICLQKLKQETERERESQGTDLQWMWRWVLCDNWSWIQLSVLLYKSIPQLFCNWLLITIRLKPNNYWYLYNKETSTFSSFISNLRQKKYFTM